MADLRGVLAAVVVWVTLLNTGVSYAANKIVLVCSGTTTIDWKDISTGPYGPDTFVIDLDGGIVTWGDVAIPIVKAAGTFIEFESKEEAKALDSHSYSGTMDRVTGALYMTQHWVRESWENNDPQIPPELRVQRTEEFIYDLTCKPAKPLF